MGHMCSLPLKTTIHTDLKVKGLIVSRNSKWVFIIIIIIDVITAIIINFAVILYLTYPTRYLSGQAISWT